MPAGEKVSCVAHNATIAQRVNTFVPQLVDCVTCLAAA